MTPDELRAIRERCEAATPGPWTYDEECGYIEVPPCGTIEFKPSWTRSVHFLARVHNNFVEGEDGLGFDGAFIASARTDVLALLDEVERLTRELQVERCGVRPVDEQLQRFTDLLSESRSEVERLSDERDELLVRVANADAELRATRESYNEAVRERDKARAIANAAVRELSEANARACIADQLLSNPKGFEP